VAPWEKIFEQISIDDFKKIGKKSLKSLRVALLNPVTVIYNDKEKEAMHSTFHNDPVQKGHTGITKTLAKLKRYYYWKGMTRYITKYIRNTYKTPMTMTDIPINAFDRVIVDTTGSLPKSDNGNEYAATLICDLTKYLVDIPIANKSANGPMKTFISDMETEYTNSILNDLCKYIQIKNITSTAHHHKTV